MAAIFRRLAVETSEFYQRFLEVWKSKKLPAVLEQTLSPLLSASESKQPSPDLPAQSPNRELESDKAAASSEPFEKVVAVRLEDETGVEKSNVIAAPGHERMGPDRQKIATTGPADRSVRDGKADSVAASEESDGVGHLDIVVYGVGSISGSDTSRCQLAFALLLKLLVPVCFKRWTACTLVINYGVCFVLSIDNFSFSHGGNQFPAYKTV